MASAESPWLAAGVHYQRKFTSARSEGSERSSELYLCGSPCASLLCWPFVTGAPCECEGKLAHILQGVCGRAINGAFGRAGRSGGCSGARCNAAVHLSDEGIRGELGTWWEARHGEPPVFCMAATGRSQKGAATTAARGERSTASAGDVHPTVTRCTLPAARVVELMRAHESDSKYIAMFLAAPYLQQMLEDDGLRSLLAMRSRVKEVSEGLAACELIRSLVKPEVIAEGGQGVLVLDVCSGKGLGATLVSFLLPRGRVVMFDANGNMDLSHVKSRPNMSFRHLDIFSDGAPSVLRSETAGATITIALGMHLCGALSPRFIDLALAIESIDAMALCPCCLKGAHGKAVAFAARSRGVDSYGVLLETLQAICEREIALRTSEGKRAATVSIVVDPSILSPKNAFVTITKSPMQ
ncbi:hypothetical protein AB1Y20_015241 [Prymnesium parvum]|uniref:Methyltransferase domain-containing protein n=1 Tax=Prymnesium parvum TaxID=97485 RepID=A0AB34K057_PRYPA